MSKNLKEFFSSVEQTFHPHLDQVSKARAFVTQACINFGVDNETLEIVILLTSEVVTNAFIHGRSHASVTVYSDGTWVHVEVYDDNSRLPQIQSMDSGALDGRGLQIIDVASTHWGATKEGHGKIVWFGVNCPENHEARPNC